MFRSPHGPYIELYFYFGPAHPYWAVEQAVLKMLQHGRRLAGRVWVSSAPEQHEEVHLYTAEELQAYIDEHPDHRFNEITLQGSVYLHQYERVKNYMISENTTSTQPAPMVIWISGDEIDMPEEFRNQKAYEQKSLAVYESFRSLVLLLDPLYAAITIEEPMPRPVDINPAGEGLAFEDVYLRPAELRPNWDRSIKGLLAQAYQEDIGQGRYISTYAAFNPVRQELPQKERAQISVLISRQLKVVYNNE